MRILPANFEDRDRPGLALDHDDIDGGGYSAGGGSGLMGDMESMKRDHTGDRHNVFELSKEMEEEEKLEEDELQNEEQSILRKRTL